MKRKYFLFLMGLFALTACQPDLHFLPESFQSPTADISGGDTDVSLVFPADAGFASLGFQSNQDWTVSFVNDRAKEWCSIPFESGRKGAFTLTVSVAANADYDERSASIVLSCGDLRRTIVVTQKQRLCWKKWGWQTGRRPIPISSPAGSSSGRPSPGLFA